MLSRLNYFYNQKCVNTITPFLKCTKIFLLLLKCYQNKKSLGTPDFKIHRKWETLFIQTLFLSSGNKLSFFLWMKSDCYFFQCNCFILALQIDTMNTTDGRKSWLVGWYFTACQEETNQLKKFVDAEHSSFVRFFLFNGISTFVDYLMPKSSL